MRAVTFAIPQRRRGGQIDGMSQHKLTELPCALTGHIIPIGLKDKNWDFTRLARNVPLHHYQMQLMARETCVLCLEVGTVIYASFIICLLSSLLVESVSNYLVKTSQLL
uniref:Uncharacterized protein n=1 Tax=Cannabis sativa TaxID=3483 RepID=A0A803R6Y7_CANSA